MITYLIWFVPPIVAAFLSISIFNRGIVGVSLLVGIATLIASIIAGTAVAGFATLVSSHNEISRWTVSDVNQVATSEGVYYSYFNGDKMYTLGLNNKDEIRSTDEDQTYRLNKCGKTPDLFETFLGNMGECTHFLYVAEADR